MRFTGVQQTLQFDKWNDFIYPIGEGGGIVQEVLQTLFWGGISEDQVWDGESDLDLDGTTALWIWAHGNRHRDAIAAGPDESVTPNKLAERLAGKLSKQDTGNVVVWSCWGGAPGGFVEHFAAFMRGRGFGALHFWGATEVTGMMSRSDENQWANVTVYGNKQSKAHGLDLAGNSGLNFGGSRFATQADMRGFGPGLRVPHFHSYEV